MHSSQIENCPLRTEVSPLYTVSVKIRVICHKSTVIRSNYGGFFMPFLAPSPFDAIMNEIIKNLRIEKGAFA